MRLHQTSIAWGICVSVMVLLPDRLAAQGHLTGKVVDAQTGTPLAAARVTVGAQTVTTGTAGKYHLIVPPGRTEVRFSAIGYATRRDTLDIADGAVIMHDASLTRQPVTLAEVSTVGTRNADRTVVTSPVEGTIRRIVPL